MFLALTKIQTNYYRTNFFLLFSRSTAKSFHRSNDKEGSRSIAERFVVVIRTKPSPAHVQRSVVTFPIANIVTLIHARPLMRASWLLLNRSIVKRNECYERRAEDSNLLENETVWLTQAQMAELFEKDRTVVGRHISNVFKEGELVREEVSAKIAHTTRHGAIKGKLQTQETTLYNLDVIISVGYRVHSKRGTAFRIWARKIIKDYLVKGYVVNERIRHEQIGELRQLVGMLGRTLQNQAVISTDETTALFEVVTDYTYALDTLDNYDYERLAIDKTTKQEKFHATYEKDVMVKVVVNLINQKN